MAELEGALTFISCPFCSAPEFDLPGLKSHLLNGDCSAFESVEDLRRMFSSEAELPRLEVNPTRSIELPYCISANDFWRTTYAAKLKRVIVYTTPEARAWKEDAGWRAKAAGIKQPTAGPIALRITHHHKALTIRKGEVVRNGHVFDLDNVLKVTIDALKGVVYGDDRQVKKMVVEYGEPTEKGKVVVGVEDLPEAQQSLFPKPESNERKDGLPF